MFPALQHMRPFFRDVPRCLRARLTALYPRCRASVSAAAPMVAFCSTSRLMLHSLGFTHPSGLWLHVRTCRITFTGAKVRTRFLATRAHTMLGILGK